MALTVTDSLGHWDFIKVLQLDIHMSHVMIVMQRVCFY